MVDEQARPNACTGMDVDACAPMCQFRDDACQQRHTQHMQLVSQSMMDHGLHAGIAQQDLIDAARGRIAVVGGQHIAVEQAAQRRQG